MRKLLTTLAIQVILVVAAAPLWAAQHLRLDLAGVGATDGPSPGVAVGFDVQIDPEWFWGIRASRLDDGDATATGFLAGLEYGFPNQAGTFAPYLGYRVGGRWSAEDVEVCTGWKHPRCSVQEVQSDGFLYQAAAGFDFTPKGTVFGATAEVAFSDSTDADSAVEFVVGVTVRP